MASLLVVEDNPAGLKVAAMPFDAPPRRVASADFPGR